MSERPKTKMTLLSKVIIRFFLLTWAGWIACSAVAVYASPSPPPAGSGGFAIVLQVLAVALTGATPVGWALTGSRIFGVAFLLAIVLAIWRSSKSRSISGGSRAVESSGRGETHD